MYTKYTKYKISFDYCHEFIQVYCCIYRVDTETNIELKQEFGDTKGVIRIRKLKKKKNRPQWSKEKEQKDKQRSTKHTHKTKHRVTRTPQIPRYV